MDYTPKNTPDPRNRIIRMDGSALLRPQTLPALERGFAFIIVAAALAIGMICCFNIGRNVIYASDVAEEQINAIIKSAGSVNNQPALLTMVGLSDSECVSGLEGNGITLTTLSSSQDGDSQLNIVKLNDKAAESVVQDFYKKSGSGYDAIKAANVLINSYNLTIDRTQGTVFKLRYADFSSGSIQAAVSNAIAQQGFDTTQISGNGVDDMGNTFAEGNATYNGNNYTWRVSAIGLKEVYPISGLPENSFFVGIRLSA